ncbi:MAG: hypothetical protein H6563_02200 [Lewinellaceae bacterium]|nr:hypothetical protein [Lewinellaceae bacterium]
METGILTEGKRPELIKEAIEKVVNPKGYEGIKANLEDYDTPSRLHRKDEEAFIPDITGVKAGRKSYFELAMKNDTVQESVTKWKLLSSMARLHSGKLYLIVPKGHFTFTQKLVKEHSILATIVRI